MRKYVEKRQKKKRFHRQKTTNSMSIGVYNGKENQSFQEGRLKQMDNKKNLLGQLQTLRYRLHELAEARGSLTDPDVIALSEEADRLIVVLQQLQRDELAYPHKRAEHTL